jgi:hypothetical protein
MAELREPFDRNRLRSPRAAAVAGILFAVLYGSSTVLIRWAIPESPTSDLAPDPRAANLVNLALNLIPYAGIAFLWFVGVIRDRLGAQEDRLFATVFLGSGLLFLAMTFVSAAVSGGLLLSYATAPDVVSQSGVLLFGRHIVSELSNIYAIRMAGVAMITLGTIWLRTGAMHRMWAIVTYLLAAVLLISVGYSLWMTLVFPGWVLAVSISIQISSFRNQEPKATDKHAPA